VVWKRVGSRVRDRGTKEVDVEMKKSRDGTRALQPPKGRWMRH